MGIDAAAFSIGPAFASILACSEQADIDTRLLRPVAQAIDASSGVYFRFAMTPHHRCHASAYRYSGGSPEAPDSYLDGFYQQDPVIQGGLEWLHDPRRPFNPIANLSSEAIRDASHRLYRDAFLRRYNIGHVLALMVPCSMAAGPQLICVGFHRMAGDQPFTEQEIAAFERLSPAMTSTLRLMAFQEHERLSHEVLSALSLSGGGLGFVILDSDLAIENANALGLADLGIYASGSGSSKVLGEVRRLLIDHDQSGLHGEHHLLSTEPEHGLRSVDISVRRLNSGGRDRYLLVSSEPLTARLLASASKKFTLTEREAQIARLVAAGLNNALLARELGIALRTVENHLRSIYAKVGVGSRTHMVSKLLQLQ